MQTTALEPVGAFADPVGFACLPAQVDPGVVVHVVDTVARDPDIVRSGFAVDRSGFGLKFKNI